MSTRRQFIVASAGIGFFGCVSRRPETPLAHLHGKAWVSGAYSHYAEAYLNVESQARKSTFDAYKLLAQKGVVALDGLQAREVPFYIRVADDQGSFRVERDVPERLTFTGEMGPADRERATRAWKLAREHIHTDYEEIARLDFALTSLLTQIARVRFAVDEGRIEQFRLVRQLGSLDAGGALPFELPYQVSRQDYQRVVLLLLERLESDRERLRRAEASIVAVGLTARATDAGSASLAANVRKVLLAVVHDASKDSAPSAGYPEREDEQTALLARARALRHAIAASPEYSTWLNAQLEQEDVLGKLLTVLDAMTGLPASGVYKQVMRIWRGGGDYLGYLELAVAFVPASSGISAILGDAVSRTREVRSSLRRSGGADELARALGASASARSTRYGGALVNVATEHARRKLDRQLCFFGDEGEARGVAEELAATALARDPLPVVPRAGQ